MPSYEPDRARSATPGRVHVDDTVRVFFERRAQSLRYPQKQTDRPAYTNGTLPQRRSDFPGSERQNSRTVDTFERDAPLPPPSLVQNASIDTRASIRRTEMSLIANQEDDRATARGRAPPTEFYSNPANRFKSLPLPPKKKKEEQKNFLVKSYRWLKKTLLGKKTKTETDMRHMEPPRPPPSHTRSYSLPRNTRFARNKSSRREPTLNPQLPPAPQLIPSATLQRVPPSRSSDFFLPHLPSQQEPIHQPVRRSGSFHQSGDRRSLVAEEQLDDIMNPLQLGFPNLGNSCYWNAILQALGALEPVASSYLGRDTKRTRSNSDLVPAEECSLIFTKLIEAMWKNSDGGDYIKKLRAIFHKENINFGKACQEDAHEFLMCLINMLSKDAAGNECFDPATNAVGLDQGAFKANLKGYLKNEMYCCTCNYHPTSRMFFTPFITLSFPEKTDATLSFKAINDTASGRGRVVLHSVHVNSTAGMIAAHKLIAHETRISDCQLLLFQVSGTTFSQTMIDEHDLVRNRFSKPEQVYATQLDQVALVNGIEVVTVLFFHAEQHPEYGMRRITEPFKCVLPLNATYAEIVNAIKTASGPVFRQTNNPLLFANDILIVDDNEFEGRPLSRVTRNPLVHAQANRCMDEQTRIFPNLPRFLRLVVRWKSASNIIYPRHDNIVAHPSYVEPTPPNYPVTLSLLFAKYFAAEYINDWSCERCKGKGAIRTTRYACAPNIIAVSCKRFRFMPNGTATKIETPVIFNLDNVNISQFVDDATPVQQKAEKHSYDVVSFACHYGNTESGHYYSYARSPTTDQWRRYDDNIVNSKPQMNDTNAYVIFLQNHNDRMNRKRGMCTLLKETSIFQSLRSRRSRESLNRIPNGPSIATEEAPFRRGSDQQTTFMNGGFNRADVSRSSRQTHL